MIATTSGHRLIASKSQLQDQALRALATAEGLLMGMEHKSVDYTSGAETDRAEGIVAAANAWTYVATVYAGMMDS